MVDYLLKSNITVAKEQIIIIHLAFNPKMLFLKKKLVVPIIYLKQNYFWCQILQKFSLLLKKINILGF